MSGIQIRIDTTDLGRLNRALARFSSRYEQRALRKAAEKEAQNARNRITTTKTAPDGSTWKPWSTHYERFNAGGTMLLQSGDLLDSIESNKNVVSADVAYAAPVQSERPFLAGDAEALADAMNAEIQDLLDESVGRL